MHRARREEDRDGGTPAVHAAIAQHDEARAVVDGLLGRLAQGDQRALERRSRIGRLRVEDRREHAHREVAEHAAHERRELVVGEHRLRQLEQAALPRRLDEQVAFASDAARERHHELLPDRIDRRVRHLRELLLEVPEEDLRPLAENGERRVVAHAAGRLLAGRGHRRQQDAQVLAGVAVGAHAAVPLARRQRRRACRADVRIEAAEVDLVALEPLRVRVVRRDLVLDLLVAHDARPIEVDEEHAPRLQAPLLDHVVRLEVGHAELARGDHESAARGHVLHGAQAVAVERRADVAAVGEAQRRRPVPRLDERRVVLVERAPLRRHLRLPLPRLGHEHHHHVRQAAAARDEEVDHVVERRRVAASGADDRLEVGQVLAERVALEQRLARRHPALVAAKRVDLAVVRDVPVRVRALPRGERVGAEARVHERELAARLVGAKIQVERVEPLGERQPLVDDGLRREAREVEAGEACLAREPTGALPDHEERPLEDLRVAHAPDEELLEDGHGPERERPELSCVDRDVAPADHLLVVVADGVLEDAHLDRAHRRVRREEALRDAVVARQRELDARAPQRALVVRVGDVDEDAGAIARAGVATGRAAVREPPQDLEAHADDLMRGRAAQVSHEAQAACVALVRRVVQPGSGRQRHGHGDYVDSDAPRQGEGSMRRQ